MTTQRRKQPAKTAAAPTSQRDRLLARPRPSLAYPLLVDQDAVDAARRDLGQAHADARQAMLAKNTDDAEVQAAQRRITDAEQAVHACYETVVLRALPPGDVERLRADHPPTEQQMAAAKAERERAAKRGEEPPLWPEWNEDTFRPALLAACTPDSGMGADDWATFLQGHVSDGEARGLWLACLAVNARERVADPLVLPKGSTLTNS